MPSSLIGDSTTLPGTAETVVLVTPAWPVNAPGSAGVHLHVTGAVQAGPGARTAMCRVRAGADLSGPVLASQEINCPAVPGSYTMCLHVMDQPGSGLAQYTVTLAQTGASPAAGSGYAALAAEIDSGQP